MRRWLLPSIRDVMVWLDSAPRHLGSKQGPDVEAPKMPWCLCFLEKSDEHVNISYGLGGQTWSLQRFNNGLDLLAVRVPTILNFDGSPGFQEGALFKGSLRLRPIC